jgi:hypothetical protein
LKLFFTKHGGFARVCCEILEGCITVVMQFVSTLATSDAPLVVSSVLLLKEIVACSRLPCSLLITHHHMAISHTGQFCDITPISMGTLGNVS